MDIQCQTWAMEEDTHHRYCVTRKVIFDFLRGANYFNLMHGEGDVDSQAGHIIWNLFMGDNVGQSVGDVQPENLQPILPRGYIPTDQQLSFDF
jgi:hypothetical protein